MGVLRRCWVFKQFRMLFRTGVSDQRRGGSGPSWTTDPNFSPNREPSAQCRLHFGRWQFSLFTARFCGMTSSPKILLWSESIDLLSTCFVWRISKELEILGNTEPPIPCECDSREYIVCRYISLLVGGSYIYVSKIVIVFLMGRLCRIGPLPNII